MKANLQDFMDNVDARVKRNAAKIQRNVVVRATLTHSDVDTGTVKRKGTTSKQIPLKQRECA